MGEVATMWKGLAGILPVLWGVLCILLGTRAVRQQDLAASPGANLDWTKEDPQKVTKYMLHQVKSATASWNRMPKQMRTAKRAQQHAKKMTDTAGEAVSALQGEMDKAYAIVAGLGSDGTAAATKSK